MTVGADPQSSSRPHPGARPTRILANLALAAVSTIVALGGAEITLRAVVPPSREYFALVPGANWTLTLPPGAIHGLTGVARIRVNRRGIRGRDFGVDGSEYRILAVGGSTTQCTVLDDTKAWPHVLEAELGRTADGRAVWVGNVGRNGATARDHVVQLKYLLQEYPPIDAVISLVGVNDMLSALHQGWGYRLPPPVTEHFADREQLNRAFSVLPSRIEEPVGYGAGTVRWYKATALWQLARRANQVRQSHRNFTMRGTNWIPIGLRVLDEARLQRQATTEWIDSVPPLKDPLFEYRRNLNAMADIAAAAGIRLVFVTQPSVWRDTMSAAEKSLLWFGWLGADRVSAHGYFTTRALRSAMARYNDALLAVCRERSLDCVDAAHVLPSDTTVMYDDVHFNDRGSLSLAQVLAAHFRERSPFGRPE